MAGSVSGDESLAGPRELLARYRDLCETAGGFRTSGDRMPRDIREELSQLEAELQTRLWLGSANGDASANGEKAKPPRSRKSAASKPRPALDTPVPPSLPEVAATKAGTATVFSDGACQGNPGPGGYAAIVKMPGQPDKEIHGGKARTTNNEMELTAALMGLREAVSMGADPISVVSDSEYLVKGMTSWLPKWAKNGWKTTMGNPVKNRQLWEDLQKLSHGRTVSWSWTRGHSGHPENERCDILATAAARRAGDAHSG